MSPTAITAPAQAPHTGKQTSIASSKLAESQDNSIPAWVKPDLPRLLRVEHLPGAFAARSVSLVDLPAGAVFARINSPTPAKCAYTSVQASKTLHIELNSDLVYINHSCRPTLVFDMARWEVRVNPALTEGLKAGDELTFFYPSTEWHMAQPFDCLCKAAECRGRITGAKDMPADILSRYWINAHIEELLHENGVVLTKENGAKEGN